MSSFIGHGLIGASLGLRLGWFWRILLIFFACLPDIEYLLYWVSGIALDPRWTHSIGFVVTVWLLFALGLLLFRIAGASRIAGLALVAGLSHLLLDYCVGVHENPVFAPVSWTEIASPIGLLPSAGAPDPSNFYFWRNAVIEVGILEHFVWLALRRPRTVASAVVSVAIAVPFLVWSIMLVR